MQRHRSAGNIDHQASAAVSDTVARLIALLGEVLSLTPEVLADMDRDTPLFGNLPELDSMAVATVLTAIEDAFDILIDDEDISGELFENVGSLADFIHTQLTD